MIDYLPESKEKSQIKSHFESWEKDQTKSKWRRLNEEKEEVEYSKT